MTAFGRGLAVASLVLAFGCGAEVPPGGGGAMPRVPEGPRVARQVDAADLLPKDLDLVVRVDLARMRAGLGPEATKQLSARAVSLSPSGKDDEAILAAVLERADVVWVGMRVADVESGDRVVIAEGKLKGLAPEPDSADWNITRTAIKDVLVYERVKPPTRSGTARIITASDRVMAFVSPVQVTAVDRVLRMGPDEGRGDPAAEGIISIDLRPRPLPWLVAHRYKHIAGIIEGVERVRATLSLIDEGARLEGEITAKSTESAEKAMKFLAILRDNVQEPKYVELLSKAKLEQVGKRVQLRWEVPARAMLALVASGAGEPAPPDPSPRPKAEPKPSAAPAKAEPKPSAAPARKFE